MAVIHVPIFYIETDAMIFTFLPKTGVKLCLFDSNYCSKMNHDIVFQEKYQFLEKKITQYNGYNIDSRSSVIQIPRL
jgi:hypothetical protein